jgi:AmmeMemoRadiSam system protein B
VASSDLSHFYPATVAHQLDRVALDDLIDFDALALMSHLEEGKTEACGGGPIVAVLTALKKLGASRVDVVGYATSGDVTGDDRSVVGYASAVVS